MVAGILLLNGCDQLGVSFPKDGRSIISVLRTNNVLLIKSRSLY